MSTTHLQPDQQKKLKNALDEISNSMTRMEGDRDFIKETKKKIKKDLQLEGKLINRLAKTHHKNSFAEEVASDEDFATTYEVVSKTVS